MEAASQLAGVKRHAAFAVLRKKGILRHNMRQLTSGSPDANLLCERRSAHGSKLVMCTGCKGFFAATVANKHRLICRPDTAETGTGVVFLPVALLQNLMCTKSEEFKSEVLRSLRLDDVGAACVRDAALVAFGELTYAKMKRRNTSSVRKVLGDMRRMASLYHRFLASGAAAHGNPPSAADMLLCENFPALQRAIGTYAQGEGTKYKPRAYLCSLLKAMASMMSASCIVRQEEAKCAELERFMLLLQRSRLAVLDLPPSAEVSTAETQPTEVIGIGQQSSEQGKVKQRVVLSANGVMVLASSFCIQ